MIWESQSWKDPLLEAAMRLREEGKVSDDEDRPEELMAQLERDIFIGFYSIRKLIEAGAKVSKKTQDMRCRLLRYEKIANAGVVDRLNMLRFHEHYDMDQPHQDERDLLYVAHQLIHSFLMTFGRNGESDPVGIFFCSDRSKEKRLYFIELQEIARVFEVVGNDYPSSFRMQRDPVTGEMTMTALD